MHHIKEVSVILCEYSFCFTTLPLDIVWPDTKKSFLIDSIFRNFYIPPVIFAVRVDPTDGSEMRVCVDGKQRLTSISRFMDGMQHYIIHDKLL